MLFRQQGSLSEFLARAHLRNLNPRGNARGFCGRNLAAQSSTAARNLGSQHGTFCPSASDRIRVSRMESAGSLAFACVRLRTLRHSQPALAIAFRRCVANSDRLRPHCQRAAVAPLIAFACECSTVLLRVFPRSAARERQHSPRPAQPCYLRRIELQRTEWSLRRNCVSHLRRIELQRNRRDGGAGKRPERDAFSCMVMRKRLKN